MKVNRLFYGWWIVGGCFLVIAATAGIAMNSFPVAYGPLADTFGFQMGDIAVTTSVMAVSAMLTSIFVGKLMETVNIRWLMTLSGFIYATGLVMFSRSTTLTHFYICSVLIGIGAAGTYLIPPSVMITNWFEEKRGLAMAIFATGGGIGGMVFGPLMSMMITRYGFSTTFLFFGILAAVMILPVSLFFVRLKPEDLGLAPYGSLGHDNGQTAVRENGPVIGQAARTASFWLLCLAFFLNGASIMGVQQHIPAYFEHIGYSVSYAAFIFALVNGLLVVGKLVFGALNDRFGTRTSMVFLYSMPALALVLLFAAKIKFFAWLFCLFSGFSAVFMTLPIALWTADILGKRDFAVTYSIMNVFSTLGVAVGVPLTGYIFDISGSYEPAWYLYLALCAVSFIMALLAFAKKRTSGRIDPEVLGKGTSARCSDLLQ